MEIRLSVVIITYNEEENIGRCLKSVKPVADEIIVVDSFSTDHTEKICKQYQVSFYQHTFQGHKEQKNYALKLASGQYILSLDADEELSPELQDSISSGKTSFEYEGYKMNRLTYYQGKWIRHGGWYPDTKIRLVKTGTAHWSGNNPHDQLIMIKNNVVGFLKGDILHYSFKDFNDHAYRTNTYSSIESQAAFQRNVKAGLLKLLFNPAFTFFKKYFLQLGILDGYNGLLIAAMAGYGKFLKYAKLRDLYNKKVSSSALSQSWSHHKEEEP